MKRRIGLLAASLFVTIGLSSCYTEFATTGSDYYNQGSQGYAYYDSSSSGYAYDSTGAPIINNYNYYGYGYPYYDYYDNWWTPSPWWWHTDLWLGWGWDSWAYAGPSWYGGWPYRGGYDYYSPFYPYGTGYGYRAGNPRVRPSNIGDTRNGRENYGGGSAVQYVQPVGSSAGVGSANATGGRSASANRTQPPTTRARTSTPSSTGSPSGGAVDQPRTRTPNSQPQSQPATQGQPRSRDNGSSGSNNSSGSSRGSTNSNGNSQPRPRGMSASSHRVMSPSGQSRAYVRSFRYQSAPAQPSRGYSQARAASSPRSVSVAHSAPPPARSGGSNGGGRGRR